MRFYVAARWEGEVPAEIACDGLDDALETWALLNSEGARPLLYYRSRKRDG